MRSLAPGTTNSRTGRSKTPFSVRNQTEETENGGVATMGGFFSNLGKLWGGTTPPPILTPDAGEVLTPPPEPLSPQAAPQAAVPVPRTEKPAEETAQAAPAIYMPGAIAGNDEDAILLRREIVNTKLEVEAYEFSLRGELFSKVRASGKGLRHFADSLLIDHIRKVSPNVLRQRRIVIAVSEDSLHGSALNQLPPRSRLMLRPEQARRAADAALIARVATLREQGVEVWADDCAGTPWFASMAGLLDGVVLRVAMQTPLEISDQITLLKRDHATLPRAAWNVNTMDEYESLRGLGCEQFAGGFVLHRGNWSGNALSPQVLSVATLINQVRQDADMHEISRVLRMDMALSYKLMRYANSASHSLHTPISSIEQALLLMGQDQLDRWLTLLLISGGLGGNGAVLEAALTRARFMELLGQHWRGGELCDQLFVLGLFSMLDIALHVPLAEAIKPLNLPANMRDALLEHKGTAGAFLALAEASQTDDADNVLRHAVALGLTVRKVNARMLEALEWVNVPEAGQDAGSEM